MFFTAEEPTATNREQADINRNVYETIEDVPPKPTYDCLSTSTPKPSQPQSPPKAAAAAAIYDVIKDDVHFAATSDSNGNAGNFYDTIEDVPTTSLTSSTRQPPGQSLTGADSVYLHVQPRSSSTSAPSEPTLLSPSLAEPAAATDFYVPMDRAHLESSSASPPSPSQPTPPPSQSPPEANNVYIRPSTSNGDVRPCSYELERVPT